MDGDRHLTPAQAFVNAVWGTPPEALSTAETVVLLAYARAAKRGGDAAWLTQRRIQRECKIGSSETAVRVRKSVIDKGWLAPVDVVLIRGGTVTVYRLTIPEPYSTIEPGRHVPDSLTEPGEQQSDSLTEPGRDRPGSTIEPLSPAPGSTIEQGDLPGSVSEQGREPPGSTIEQGHHQPGSTIEPSAPLPGSTIEPLYDVKRFTVHNEAVRFRGQPCSITEPGIYPENLGPPVGGVPKSGERAAARPRECAREAGDPEGPPSRFSWASMNGKEPMDQADAKESIRRTLEGRKGSDHQ